MLQGNKWKHLGCEMLQEYYVVYANHKEKPKGRKVSISVYTYSGMHVCVCVCLL